MSTTWASKVKNFQRRATQKVLQQMGIAEKTTDDVHSQIYNNFTTMSTFISQFKGTIQNSVISMEKMCSLQSNLSNQVQTYIHTELSGETDQPGGDLYEFFAPASNDESKSEQAVMLQEIAEKFYSACVQVGNSTFDDLHRSIEAMIVHPLYKDEELNQITKELIEERKARNLDYDSYRRTYQSTTSPVEQERYETKMKNAKERFDVCTKKVHEHIAHRNQVRCKIIIHSILTLIQRYHEFFSSTAAILQETAALVQPLAEIYQLDDSQLMSLFQETPNSPPKPTAKTSARPPSKPSSQNQSPAPTHNPPSQNQPQNQNERPRATTSPPLQRPPSDNPLEEFMQQSVEGIKKPANSTPPPTNGKPMNSMNSATSNGSPSPSSNSHPPTSSPPPQNQPPQPQPNIFEDNAGIFDAWGGPNSPPLQPQQPTQTNSNSNPLNMAFEDDLLNFDFKAQQPLKPETMKPEPAKPPTSKPSAPTQQTPLQPQPASPPFNQQQQNSFQTPLQPQSTAKPPPASQPTYKPPFQGNVPNYGGYKQPAGYPPQQPNYGAYPMPGMQGGYKQPAYGGGGGFMPQGGGFMGQHPPPGYGAYPGYGYPQQPTTPAPSSEHVPAHMDERDQLDPKITDKIKQWSERGGRKNNLRALLSTMHEVLWEDSGWEVKGLSELVTSGQVKKAYRQANLIVHPDKVATGTTEQKLIAQRIFETLREGYEVFKNEPGQS